MATTQRAQSAQTGAQSSAVATIDRKGITSLLESETAKNRILPLLFNGVEYGQIVGEVYLAAGENPEILQCTPASIIRAVGRAVSWGLVIGETAHLIPFNVNVAPRDQDPKFEKRLKAVQDYKGKIELIVNAGGAKSLVAQVVYDKEFFEYEQGTNPFIKHKPAPKSADRGAMIGAYAIADHGFNRLPTILYMPIAEIDEIRKGKSKQWKGLALCPPWYAKKTVIHQIAKFLPKNQRLALALRILEQDEDLDDALPAGEQVATVEAPKPAQQLGAGVEHDLSNWVEESEETAAAREPGQED